MLTLNSAFVDDLVAFVNTELIKIAQQKIKEFKIL
jgi:hypothetical protein